MITPVKLQWPEINRLLDIIQYAPCQVHAGDFDLMEKTGLFRVDHEGGVESVELVEGAEAAFLEYTPHARVRDEWRSDKFLPTEKEAISPEVWLTQDKEDCNVANDN